MTDWGVEVVFGLLARRRHLRHHFEGNAELDLSFRRSEVSDLLKSLVVDDAGAGHIDAITYSSPAPAQRVLEKFALNLADNPPLSDLLLQLCGEEVNVHAPQPVTGKIVSVEERQVPINDNGEKFRKLHVLNLWAEGRVKPIHLDNIASIEFTSPRLQREFTKALETLAGSHSTVEKAVHLQFTGQQKRQVRVGYVQETRVWKMTYRLVL
jgi:hypothetical protein